MQTKIQERRVWRLDMHEDPETGERLLDPAELDNHFLELSTIVNRLGGAVIARARREEGPDGTWQTTAVEFMWQPFAGRDAVSRQPAEDAGDLHLVEVAEERDPEPALSE